jgi:hypothetical protein
MCRPLQISDAPVAYVWENFISDEEARHIVEAAAPRMRRSMVSGEKKIHEVRMASLHACPRVCTVTGIPSRRSI